MRNYWLSVEGRQNWLADRAKGFRDYGFRISARTTVAKIAKGDFLITYITKSSTFADVREVASPQPSKVAEMREYAKGESDREFELKIDTRPVVVLEPDQWIPIKTLLEDLILTRGRKDWGVMVRTSIRRLEPQDGIRLYDEIRAVANPPDIGS